MSHGRQWTGTATLLLVGALGCPAASSEPPAATALEPTETAVAQRRPRDSVSDTGSASDAEAASSIAETTIAAEAPDLGVPVRIVDGAAAADGVKLPPLADAGLPDTGVALNPTRDYSTDRRMFFGNSRCAQAKFNLCEDFESGGLNPTLWRSTGSGWVVDGIQKARGAKALHIVRTGGNAESFIHTSKTFPATNNTYYGRAFVYFESLPGPPMTFAHWTIIASAGSGGAREIRIGGLFSQGFNRFGIGTDDPAGTGDWTLPDQGSGGKLTPVPTKEWLCLEWMYKGDTNETRFWWDGVERKSMYTSASRHGGNQTPFILPKVISLSLGWVEYQATTQRFELWLDEIAVDKERIGCVL